MQQLPPSGTAGNGDDGGTTPACAACRNLQRRCTAECLLAPYFPPDEPERFDNIHKVFGIFNVSNMLSDIPRSYRDDCVNALAYEAKMRIEEPIYGCVGVISLLHLRITYLESQLARFQEAFARAVFRAERDRAARHRLP